MHDHISKEFNFIGTRKIFFTLSLILLVASVIGIGTRGLNFGIEFQGGTSIDFSGTGTVTIEQMRDAFADVDEADAVVQSASTAGEAGFLVRTAQTDPNLATAAANDVAAALDLGEESFTVTTIGPEWGSSITSRSLLAFLFAIVAIIIYISLRFEPKMSLTAVSALFHDILILVGVYAWTQFEVTPNVIAAVLTIMGYSLYDTVVVFSRIGENAAVMKDGKHKTYYQIANFSINEVFVRTINTSITSLIPVLAMLFFGGDTLKDFAFAMSIGLVCGTYSSFGIATPLFAMWKTREAKWGKMEKHYGELSLEAGVPKSSLYRISESTMSEEPAKSDKPVKNEEPDSKDKPSEKKSDVTSTSVEEAEPQRPADKIKRRKKASE